MTPVTTTVVPGMAFCIPLANAVAKEAYCISANDCPVLTVCVTNTVVDKGVAMVTVMVGDEVGATVGADRIADAAAMPERYAPCTVAGYRADVCSPAKYRRLLRGAARLLRSVGWIAPTRLLVEKWNEMDGLKGCNE